jgi:hypothetical protein
MVLKQADPTQGPKDPRIQGPKDPRTQGPKDPSSYQRTRGPEDPRTRGPEDPRTRGSEDPRTRGPEGQALNEEDSSDSEDENRIGRQTLLDELLGELYPKASATRRLKYMIRTEIQRNEDMSKHFNLMTNEVGPEDPRAKR